MVTAADGGAAGCVFTAGQQLWFLCSGVTSSCCPSGRHDNVASRGAVMDLQIRDLLCCAAPDCSVMVKCVTVESEPEVIIAAGH